MREKRNLLSGSYKNYATEMTKMHKVITTPIPSMTPSETEIYLFVSKITSKATQNDLIKVLQAVQNKYGYLPKAGLKAISHALRLPLSRAYGVATFYHQFRLEPPGRYVIHMCRGTACHAKGNTNNYESLRLLLGLGSNGHTTKDGIFTLESARCFGCCSLAPMIMITSSNGSYKRLYGHVTSALLKKIITEYKLRALKEVQLLYQS